MKKRKKMDSFDNAVKKAVKQLQKEAQVKLEYGPASYASSFHYISGEQSVEAKAKQLLQSIEGYKHRIALNSEIEKLRGSIPYRRTNTVEPK